MEMFLDDYKHQLQLLIDSGEYDDELVNELGVSFVLDYRKYLSGLPYPLIHLGDDERKVDSLRTQIFVISQKILAAHSRHSLLKHYRVPGRYRPGLISNFGLYGATRVLLSLNLY